MSLNSPSNLAVPRHCFFCGSSLCLFFVRFLAQLSRMLIWRTYSIGRPPSAVVCNRPSSSSSALFKHLLRNHWANQSQIPYGASVEWGNESLLKWSWSHYLDGRYAIYGKNLKHLLLLNLKAENLATWIASSDARVLPNLPK